MQIVNHTNVAHKPMNLGAITMFKEATKTRPGLPMLLPSTLRMIEESLMGCQVIHLEFEVLLQQ